MNTAIWIESICGEIGCSLRQHNSPWQTATIFLPQGFPHSSIGKESTCNAGDPRLILGSGRSTGEGTGYPLQYYWSSLVAQLVKNLPAMRETCVQSLGQEDPLEKGKSTHSSILAWRIWTWLSDLHFHFHVSKQLCYVLLLYLYR